MPVTISQLKEKRREYLLAKNEVDVHLQKRTDCYDEWNAADVEYTKSCTKRRVLEAELIELGKAFALDGSEDDIQEKLPT